MRPSPSREGGGGPPNAGTYSVQNWLNVNHETKLHWFQLFVMIPFQTWTYTCLLCIEATRCYQCIWFQKNVFLLRRLKSFIFMNASCKTANPELNVVQLVHPICKILKQSHLQIERYEMSWINRNQDASIWIRNMLILLSVCQGSPSDFGVDESASASAAWFVA